MPGVPRSRGCKGCIKQKKKCDQAKPACSRCARLGTPCIGAGEQKYVFKSVSFGKTTNAGIAKSRKQDESTGIFILHKPQSSTNLVASKLVAALEMTDLRYSLGCYGDFLQHIPKRLGYSEILDASANAMISALPYHYTGELPSEALDNYTGALKALRICLNGSDNQLSPETLSAIYIIMICQGWIGRIDAYVKNHGEILAHLANTAIKQNWRDSFELCLFETLFVPLILEAMINPAITLQPWYTLIDSCLPQTTKNQSQDFYIPSLQAQNLVRMPIFFHRPMRYQVEIKSTYRELRNDHPRIQRYIQDLGRQLSSSPDRKLDSLRKSRKLFHKYQVVDAVLLTVAIALNSLLRNTYPDDNVLFLEASTLTNELIVLAQNAAQYRPLGASYIPPCLAAVWATTGALPTQQMELKALIADYQPDFPHIKWMEQAEWLKSSHELLLGQLSGQIMSDASWDGHEKLDISMVHCKAAFGSSGSCFFLQ